MRKIKFGIALSAILALTACSADIDSGAAVDAAKNAASDIANTAINSAATSGKAYTLESPKVKELLAKFDYKSLLRDPEIVDCVIGGDTNTQCLTFVLPLKPLGYELGPWCPRNISQSAEAGGKWIIDDEIYDVSGEFIENLDEKYGDPEWVLYDEDTGDVRYTDSLYACQQAARPDVAEEFFRYCIECNLDQIEAEMDIEHTWTVPIDPVIAEETTRTNRYGSGVAFSGVLLNGPAPIHAIIKAYTIAAFDDCGGHANPHEGYHIHAVIDSEDCIATHASIGDHAPEIGIAMDGYMIHHQKSLDGSIPDDLDDCHGHEADGLGYHYHAGYAGSNLILGCLTGKLAPTGMAQGDGGGDGADHGNGMGPPPGGGMGEGMGPRPDNAH